MATSTTRSKRLQSPLQLYLDQRQKAIVTYYAKRWKTTVSDASRRMFEYFALADPHFDDKFFIECVEKEIIPEYEGEKELQKETRLQAKNFVTEYKDRVKRKRAR